MSDDLPAVCVVTHPLSEASEPAIVGLLEVIGAVTAVSLITVNLPADSEIRGKFDVSQVSRAGTGSSVPIAALRFVLNQIRMSREIRRRDEEIVLFFGATAYLLPVIISKISGRTVILEPRGNVPESLRHIWSKRIPSRIAFVLSLVVWQLERIGYRLADGIIALSPAMADDLNLRRYEPKLYEHGARPVDTALFAPRVPYEDRPDRIGYLGRLDEEKGVDDLIEVVKRLVDGHSFAFVGDGSLRGEIEDKFAEEIESGRVELTGWVDHDEVAEHLNQLRLLVMTSPTEGVPTTAIEAMACGTPICAYPVGGISDVVKDWETGILLKEEDPAEVAATIEVALEQDSELSKMSAASREFIVQRYRFEEVKLRYARFFREITNQV